MASTRFAGRETRPLAGAQAAVHTQEMGPDLRWSGALGGTRTPNLLIRRLGQAVQDRLLLSVRWADIPQLSTRDRRCPTAWQQYWQQSRLNGTDPRPSGLGATLTWPLVPVTAAGVDVLHVDIGDHASLARDRKIGHEVADEACSWLWPASSGPGCGD